jgi:hypothetical protein
MRRRHRSGESFGEVGLMVVAYFLTGAFCIGVLVTAMSLLAMWLRWLEAH